MIEVIKVAKERLNVLVVGNIVALVNEWAWVDRREPEDIDA